MRDDCLWIPLQRRRAAAEQVSPKSSTGLASLIIESFRVAVNRTEEVLLEFPLYSLNMKDLPYEQLRALARYILASCANLKTLRIE